MKKIAIIGAGMAGFGAAHRFHAESVPAVLYEKHAYHGGHTASHTSPSGFTFDEGPHISFTKDERIKALFGQNVNEEFFTSKATVNNYWQGHWIPHPAQCNLFGLPTDLVLNILKDFFVSQRMAPEKIANYQDWLYANFGKTFADTFPMKYTEKYHTTTAANMSTDWVGPRMYQPNVDEVLRGALSPAAPNVHYITEFRYPKRNGFVSYLNPFVRQTQLKLSHKLTGVDVKNKVLHFANGAQEAYDHLVSSMPLPELIPIIHGAPQAVVEASRRLACSEAVIVTLGIDREDLNTAHWSYFYDHDILTSRLSTPHMQSPNNVPPGCGSFQAEVYFSKKYKPLTRKPEELIDPVILDLRKCGLLKDADKILFRHAMHVPYANVIFDLERAAALSVVHDYLAEVKIAYCGRYGEWAYIWTDESFISGENAAQQVLERL